MNVELSSDHFHQIKPGNVRLSSAIRAVPENATYFLATRGEELWPLKLELVLMKNVGDEEDLADSLELDGEIHYRALPALEVDLKAAIGAHSNVASWQEQIMNGVVKIIVREATLKVTDLGDDEIEVEVAFFGITIGNKFDARGISDLFTIIEKEGVRPMDDEEQEE